MFDLTGQESAAEAAAVIGKGLRETSARLDDVEQKMARRGSGGGIDEGQSWGAQIVAKSAEIHQFAEERNRKGSVSFDVKAITTAAASAGALNVPYRDTLYGLPQQRMTVRQLLRTVQVSTGSVEYPRLLTRTNNAAPVAETLLKPESGLTFDMVNVPLRVIAHWIEASRQVLEDSPQLRDIIDGELLYGLALREEAQLLNGDGTGQNLFGILPQATAFAAPAGAPPASNMIDTVSLALLQQDLANLPADGIVMHPSDWLRMRLLKDADGNYILGAPGANVQPQLFGRPVVVTPAIAVDTFLCGQFGLATLYDRWVPRVTLSTEDRDVFVRNCVTILAEQRLGLAIKDAKAFTRGDFGFVP